MGYQLGLVDVDVIASFGCEVVEGRIRGWWGVLGGFYGDVEAGCEGQEYAELASLWGVVYFYVLVSYTAIVRYDGVLLNQYHTIILRLHLYILRIFHSNLQYLLIQIIILFPQLFIFFFQLLNLFLELTDLSLDLFQLLSGDQFITLSYNDCLLDIILLREVL